MTSAVCRPPTHPTQSTMRCRIDSCADLTSDELSIEPAVSTTKNYRTRSASTDSSDSHHGDTHRISMEDVRARRKMMIDTKDDTDWMEGNGNMNRRRSMDGYRIQRRGEQGTASPPSTYRRESDDVSSVYSSDDLSRIRRCSVSVYSGHSTASGTSSVSSRRSRESSIGTTMSIRSSNTTNSNGLNSVDLYLASSAHKARRKAAAATTAVGAGSSGGSVCSASSRRSLDENRLRTSRDRTTTPRSWSSSCSVRESSADTHPARRTVRGGKRYGAGTLGGAQGTGTAGTGVGSVTTTTTATATRGRPQSIPEAPPTIEVAPGVTARLRGAKESYECVKHDFFLPTKCFCCSLDLFCIMDASYVLCPTCKVVGPLGEGHGDGGMMSNGGVALGITSEVLLQWQSEIAREAMNGNISRLR